MPKLIDLTGQKFGLLTVTGRAPNKGKQTVWNCLCDCGNDTEVFGVNIKRGLTTSCGCYLNKRRAEAHTVHGMNGSTEHRIWAGMRHRCNDPNQPAYKDYGGRGITVCDRWLDSFQNFFDDMGHRPPGHSIDRINNDLGYSPENCRWADRLTQANNTRSNNYVTYDGVTRTISEWGRLVGLNPQVIATRIKSGWSVNDALHRPNRIGKKRQHQATIEL